MLTEAGRELYEHAREMEAVATGIERWRDGHATRRVVRISAGAWTSSVPRPPYRAADPARRGDRDRLPHHLRAASTSLRRQADIGLRNRAPEETRLSGRRINDVAYAIYRSRDADEGAESPWIGVIGDGGITPGPRWVAARHAEGDRDQLHGPADGGRPPPRRDRTGGASLLRRRSFPGSAGRGA